MVRLRKGFWYIIPCNDVPFAGPGPNTSQSNFALQIQKLGDIGKSMRLYTFELQRIVLKCNVLIHQSLLLQTWEYSIPCWRLAL